MYEIHLRELGRLHRQAKAMWPKAGRAAGLTGPAPVKME